VHQKETPNYPRRSQSEVSEKRRAKELTHSNTDRTTSSSTARNKIDILREHWFYKQLTVWQTLVILVPCRASRICIKFSLLTSFIFDNVIYTPLKVHLMG